MNRKKLQPCSFTVVNGTAQEMKFSIKDFFINYDKIRRKQRIWSHLLKKSIMENFIFCVVHFKSVIPAKPVEIFVE